MLVAFWEQSAISFHCYAQSGHLNTVIPGGFCQCLLSREIFDYLLPSHHLCPFQSREQTFKVGGSRGRCGEECSEELACTLQVTGQWVKATSVRALLISTSGLRSCPSRRVPGTHSPARALSYMHGLSRPFVGSSSLRTTAIYREMSKTSEQGCWGLPEEVVQ